MSRLRFNHVFVPLMGLSALSAFVLPARFTNPLRAAVQGVFYPVSRPVHGVATWFEGKLEKPTDARPDKDIRIENERLKARLAQLAAQVESLQQLAADRRRLGDIAELCVSAPVMGTDPAGRDSLILNGTFDRTFLNKPVLHFGGVVGRIDRAGFTGAQVRLVTDSGFRATGRFMRVGPDADGELALIGIKTSAALVEGAGQGEMRIINLRLNELASAKVQPGDTVVLDDPEWPEPLKYREIGQVVSIAPRREAPLLAHVVVKPRRNLRALQHVMIMVRDDAGYRDDGDRDDAPASPAARTEP